MATLEAFVASVRLGSFSKAGAALSLTPSVISRQMAVLEADLGTALFERQAHGVLPTAAGALRRALAASQVASLPGASS